MAQTIDAELMREALYYGEMICNGCNKHVDLSDADGIEEGKELWNEHVREEHPD